MALDLALTLALLAPPVAIAAVALHRQRRLREHCAALEAAAADQRRARVEAEAANDAGAAFLASMGHDIRAPLHALVQSLSQLRETGLAPRQIDPLRVATESADQLLALLNDVLDLSQLESGRMTLAPAPVDLRTLLREVEATTRPQAAAKSLALHIDADPGVPERALADATRVKQVVAGLLSNAIRLSEHGAVALGLRCREGGESAGGARLLEFVVTDTGVGIDAATQARLFSRLAPGERPGGTGLGLEIARALARLMGGDITVRSAPGEGSCFTFRMPLQPVPAIPAAAAAAAAVAAVAGPAPPSAAPAPAPAPMERPLQVLVAEDHPVNRQYIAALLEDLGHAAHFTTNGREAVHALQQSRYDLVLMDLHMPVLDGVGATREIRALSDRATSTVPIVALTADAMPETRERCLVAGMNDFLTKPVGPQALAASLRRLFGSASPAPPAAAGRSPTADAPLASGTQLIDAASVRMSLQAMPAARLGAMIEAFLQQAPETARRLRAAVRDGQPLELRVNAHAAKGVALNLGLTGLAATAEALQEGASHLPAHEIARLVQRFEDQLTTTRQAAAALGLLDAPATAVP